MGYLARNDIELLNAVRDNYMKMAEGGAVDKVKLHKTRLALQAFVYKPQAIMKKKIQAMNKKVQAVGVSTDFPIITKESFNVTIESDNFDMGWEQSYRQVPLGKNQDSWEIYNVANSLTFYQVEEGQRIEVAGLSGSKATGVVDYYGGALGWTDKMIRFRKVPAMIQMAETFRNKFWVNKANNHYALLAAAAALNVTGYQGVAGNGRTRRDVLTINQAAFTLTNRLKDKGYGDMANAPLLMYANPFDEDRIEAAFRAVTNSMVQVLGNNEVAEQITSRRITRIYTYNTNVASGSPILILPGQKIQKADALAPTVYNQEQDILTLNRVQAVWAIYGAIVADTDQAQQLTLG
jgi:hypothetical protein